MYIGTLLSLVILLATACSDATFTEKRLSQIGIQAEVNQFICLLERRMPLSWAVWLGIGIPTALIAIFGVFVSQWVLTFVAGMRSTLWLLQRIQKA